MNKKLLATGIILLTVALLLMPVPRQYRIVEAEASVPKPFRTVLKHVLFNFSYHMKNFSLSVTTEDGNYTFTFEYAYVRVRSWRSDNHTMVHVSLSTRNVRVETPFFNGFVGHVYVTLDGEFGEGFEVCTFCGYVRSWVPVIVVVVENFMGGEE